MPGRTRKITKRFRFWPGIIFPLGLSLLLVLAGWQFAVGVTAEQDRRNAADDARAAAARRGAAALSGNARALAQSFVDNRLASRGELEKNLRAEIRGVMEAVNQVLTASLERSRAQGAPRREVSRFPPGFKSVENYLALSRPEAEGNPPLKALHACAPELGELLPAGCSLAVVENNAVEVFSVGGGAPAEGSLSVALNREFLPPGGTGEGLRWTLRLQLHAPDLYPPPDAGEIARYLTNEMGGAEVDSSPAGAGAVWRGWLVGANGQPVAVFPAFFGAPSGEGGGGVRQGREPPPFVAVAREWRDVGDQLRVWMESGAALAGVGLVPAVAVAVARPGEPLDLVEEFLADTRWICTLGALAFGAFAFWIWFLRGMFGGSRRRLAELEAEVEAAAVKPGRRGGGQGASSSSAGAEAVAAEMRRRLVRDRARSVAEVEGVIVADIGADGGMTVTQAQDLSAALRQPAAATRVVPLPSGSLFRLQAKHRGGKGRAGARALDRATHPVLKTLAARIRPVVGAGVAQRMQGVREDGVEG